MNYVECPESEATHVKMPDGRVWPIIRDATDGDYISGDNFFTIQISDLTAIGAIQAWLKVREPAKAEFEANTFLTQHGLCVMLPGAMPAVFNKEGRRFKVTIEEVVENE